MIPTRRDITVLDPWLAAAITGNAPAGIICDYLEDAEATLGEVLGCFAGTAAEGWQNGLSIDTLAEWVRRHENNRSVPPQFDAAAGRVLAQMPPVQVGMALPHLWGEYLTERKRGPVLRLHAPPGGFRLDNGSWYAGGVIMPIADVAKHFVGYFLSRATRDRLTLDALCSCQTPAVPLYRAGGAASVRATRITRLTYDSPPLTLTDGRAILRGQCPACNATLWALTDDAPDVRAFKRRVLALFSGVTVYGVGYALPAQVVIPPDDGPVASCLWLYRGGDCMVTALEDILIGEMVRSQGNGVLVSHDRSQDEGVAASTARQGQQVRVRVL